MITLPNGCWCSDIKVYPKNWKQVSASIRKDWYIRYRFYDPTIIGANGRPRPKLVIMKGMNVYKTVQERRDATEILLDEATTLLVQSGYNPITGTMLPAAIITDYVISPATPVIESYRKALKLLVVTDDVRRGIKSVITGLEKAAIQLRISHIPVSEITMRYVKAMLEQCGRNSKRWSNNRFNAYRGYLLMLYKELIEQEAIQARDNPVRDISKRTVIKRKKKVLSPDQRTAINKHLANVFPRFHQFVHLFFHSGVRKTEILQLKPGDVDLDRQVYTSLVKKGKQYKEVERTIKDIAVPYWEFFLRDCPADHYIFGTRFRPSPNKPMGKDMPSRYWQEAVKAPAPAGLEIDIDFYSLKHLNSTEVVNAINEEAAARLNAHTSTAMVVNIYDVNQEERKHNQLKKMSNAFS